MQNFKFTKFVFLFTLLGLVFNSGCAQKEKTNGQITYIDSKALVEDKLKNESHSVNIDVYYIPQGPCRLEITALLGYSVGSLLMSQQQVQYMIHPQKVFISGPFKAKSLKPLFKHEVDPQILIDVVNNNDLSERGFICQKQALVQTCKGQNLQVNDVTVSIEDKGQGLRKITIENKGLKLIWLFKSIKPYDKSYNETFVLKKPEEYRLLTIK